MDQTRKNFKGLAGIREIQNNIWVRRSDAFQFGRDLTKRLFNSSDFIAGLMLYWAEGSKTTCTSVSNSDVDLIVFMVRWFEKFFGIKPEFLVVQMHIHSGQNEQNMRQYWSRATGIPLENFQKSYVKLSGTGHRTKKLYYGTIKVRVKKVGSKFLLFNIFGAIAEFNFKTLRSKVDIHKWIPKPIYAE